MISTIFSILGIMVWIFGVWMIVDIVLGSKNVLEAIFVSFATGIVIGSIGALVGLHGLMEPIRNEVITYETPTSIIKTNDITIVTHIIKGDVVISSQVFKEASYYNSTNIMIEVRCGKNFYGCDVGPFYRAIDKASTE